MVFCGINIFNQRKLTELCINEQSRIQVRPQIVNVNGDDPVFLPFSIKTSKCSGSCNNINNPCTKLCFPDVLKNLKCSIQYQEPMKQDAQNGMKRVSVNIDLTVVIAIINNLIMML